MVKKPRAKRQPRWRLHWLLLCLFLLPGAPAQAAVTGTDLLLRCEASEKSMHGGTPLSPDEMLDSMWCTGYLSGLLDGFSVSDFRVGNERAVCLPEEGLTRVQAMSIIQRWLREHPEELGKSGRRNAVIALSKAFPCKGAGP